MVSTIRVTLSPSANSHASMTPLSGGAISPVVLLRNHPLPMRQSGYAGEPSQQLPARSSTAARSCFQFGGYLSALAALIGTLSPSLPS
jgi:hypothetical protein